MLSDALRDSVPRVEDELLAEVAGNTFSRIANLILADDLMLNLAFPLMDSDFTASSSLIQTFSAPAIRADWFLAPET